MKVELMVLEAHLPLRTPACLGVVLYVKSSGEVRMRFRRDWSGLADPEDAEVLESYPEYLKSECLRLGPEAWMEDLRNTLSHSVRMVGPTTIEATDLEAELERQAGCQGL